jgi:hypothetical protein
MNLKLELLEPINYIKAYVPILNSSDDSYNVYRVTKPYMRKVPYITPAYKNLDFAYKTNNPDELDNTESCFIIGGADLEYIKQYEERNNRILNVEGERTFPLMKNKKMKVIAYYKVLNDMSSPEFLNLLNNEPGSKFRSVFLIPTGIDNSTKEVFGDLYDEL